MVGNPEDRFSQNEAHLSVSTILMEIRTVDIEKGYATFISVHHLDLGNLRKVIKTH